MNNRTKKKLIENPLYQLTMDAKADIVLALMSAKNVAKDKKKIAPHYAERVKELDKLIKLIEKGKLYIMPFGHCYRYFA